MSLAKITINAFNSYTNGSIFDTLTLPDGIDRDLVIDNIILEAGEFELVYSNPDFMKSAIGVWSDKYYRTFQKWIDALNIEYAPLENYDRKEEWEDNNTSSNNGNSATNRNGGEYHTGSNNSSTSNSGSINSNNNDTTTNSVSAYDSTTLSTAGRDVSNGTSGSTSSGTTTSNDSNTENIIHNDAENVTTSNSATEKNTREGRAHGNIGVTTSQQMLESELDIAKWNIYKHITDLFMQEFCIMVYI